jgi:DNA-binding MurR/RpiR family transcriptional regulator
MPSSKPPPRPVPPSTADAFLQRASAGFAELSPQLKTIARYVERHRDHLGLEKIQDVAARCEVQPSAVVRFAKHFGYSGYSDLQRVFRDGMRIAAGRDYQARIRQVIDAAEGALAPAHIAYEFVGGTIDGLRELHRNLQGKTVDAAVELLAQAPAVWIVGARRAYPVAAYLAYAMQHTDKPVSLVSFVGAMHEGQLRGVRKRDVMVAVSFAPYAEETVTAVEDARRRGAKIIAITDSRMSPLAAKAAAAFIVHESSTFGFRALTNAMALAQGLFVALAYRLELSYTAPSSILETQP